MSFKFQNAPPFIYVKCVSCMHRLIKIVLSMVLTWYAFYKQFFKDHVDIFFIVNSQTELKLVLHIYWYILNATAALYIQAQSPIIFCIFTISPSGACKDLRFSCLGKHLKYPVFIFDNFLSYYDICLPSWMRSSYYRH